MRRASLPTSRCRGKRGFVASPPCPKCSRLLCSVKQMSASGGGCKQTPAPRPSACQTRVSRHPERRRRARCALTGLWHTYRQSAEKSVPKFASTASKLNGPSKPPHRPRGEVEKTSEVGPLRSSRGPSPRIPPPGRRPVRLVRRQERRKNQARQLIPASVRRSSCRRFGHAGCR